MNNASGGDGIPVELSQILKDDAVKALHSICWQIWKMQQWPRDWKGQFSFQSQRKAMPKNAQTTAQFHSSHMLVMLEILQARLQQYMNHELADVQAGFRRQSEWLFLLDRVFFIRSVVSKEPGLENFENYLARV